MAGMSDDVLRILANLIRYGTVSAVAGKRVLVKTGGVTTKPLPWITGRAGKTRTWSPPDIGEQVMIFSPNGDLAAGVVMPSIYSDANPPPDQASPTSEVVVFGDGAVLMYDTETHVLTGTLPARGKVAIVAPDGLDVTGDVRIKGDLSIDGKAHATGDITGDADVKAGAISLVNHPHGQVQPGPGVSGKPLP